ncbi:EAL domain-containing protein [Paenibacillus sp. HB172176]|uniref:EAL domain-containing protein n=1 Tax=Paenibacillus sp. HB172176 TaxID=2493690 RepID=UPI00143CA5E7|nr:EAL domain-containing protein [Paenibacillus sp. HB172176]
MQSCNCFQTEMSYIISINDATSIKILLQIKDYLQAKGWLIKLQANKVQLREEGIMDFYDFCQDHMAIDQLTFNTSGHEDSRPFHMITEVLEARWVDSIVHNQQIESWAQKIVDANGITCAHELLSRFIQPDGTRISPLDVFAAAKLRNRLYALDRMCRMQAVRQAVHLPNKIFINFIPTSIYSPQHCLQSTIALSRELGIDPTKFVFEVVETEYVEDLEHLKRILAYYTNQGFNYALDDVGEGFSTIELLHEIKPHYMKLDKKFVHGVSADCSKQKVAIQFLQAATEIHAVPLAEGIEQAEDFEWLKARGFQLFQGYLFGKPEPIQELKQDYL